MRNTVRSLYGLLAAFAALTVISTARAEEPAEVVAGARSTVALSSPSFVYASPHSLTAAAPNQPVTAPQTRRYRIQGEIAAAFLGVAVSTVPVVVGWLWLEKGCGDESLFADGDPCAVTAITAGATASGLSLLVAPAAFVTWAGDRRGGQGNFGAAFGVGLGVTALGVGAALSLWLPTEFDSATLLPGSVLLLAAVIGGPILGYEASSNSSSRAQARKPLRWHPTLTPARGGATVGVAGVL